MGHCARIGATLVNTIVLVTLIVIKVAVVAAVVADRYYSLGAPCRKVLAIANVIYSRSSNPLGCLILE